MMFVKLTALLTFCACALKECECGGTLEKPETDEWLCDRLRPPGLEHVEPEINYNMYTCVMKWEADVVAITLFGSNLFRFIGYILQGRVDNEPRGGFIQEIIPGIRLDCGLYPQNTFYATNFTNPMIFGFGYWYPRGQYRGKKLTLHITVIKDRNSYVHFAEGIPENPEPEPAELDISSS